MSNAGRFPLLESTIFRVYGYPKKFGAAYNNRFIIRKCEKNAC